MEKLSSQEQVAVLAELYRGRFDEFLKYAFGVVNPFAKLEWGWYLDCLCEYLAAVEKGEIRRLIINMPPRCLKSIAVTVAWPAWLMARDPSERIIASSYGESLAKKHSMDCRLIIEDEFYQAMFPATRLSDDQNEKVKYVTTARGHRLATSVGGSLTGEGAKRLIFDDLLKPDEAPSDAVRRSTNDWMTQTFLNRLDDKRVGTIVGVMQRVHQDDPCGLLLEAGGWEHLNMPAIFNKRQVFMVGEKKWVREAGDFLDAERLNKEVLDQELKNMGEYAFAGQYMQNPAPAEGGMVKWDWFKFYEDRPVGFDAVIHTWDTANKAATESDYSVGMVWGIRWDGYYLLEIVRKKLKYPELKAEVRKLYERDLPRYILVEDKASGQQLLQDYGAQRNIPMIGIVPTRDKVTRLSVVTDVIETGKVFLPKDAPWLDTFREELRVFPNGKHDDCVDCLSQFLGWAKINFDRLVENVNMFQQGEEDYFEDMSFDYGRSEISGY